MTDQMNQNGWNEWSRHVLAELQRLHGTIENLEDKIEVVKDDLNRRIESLKDEHTKYLNEELRKVQIDIAMLKVKSGVWGLIGGLIPVVIYVVLGIIQSKAS